MKRVLVVEDEGLVALEIKEILIQSGYLPLGPVTSAIEAFKLVMVSPPDLVLMDIKLHGTMDGIGAAGAIKSQTAVPVVYVSANSDPMILERVKATRPAGFVQKPFTPQQLLAAVDAALGTPPRG